MKTIALLFLGLILTTPAIAMRTAVMGGSATSLSNSSVRFCGFNATPIATDDVQIRSTVSMAGVMEGLTVELSDAPAGSASYIFNLQKNGADTAISCTITGEETTCSSTVLVAYSAGDTFSLKATPASIPIAAAAMFGTIFNSGTGGGSLMYTSANSRSASTSAVETGSMYGDIGITASSQRSHAITDGTISKMYVTADVAPGSAASGKQYVFTVLLNSVASALTCTMLETAVICNDTTHTITVVAGDDIRIQTTPSNTPAAQRFSVGFVFTPTIDGESMYCAGASNSSPSATVDTYYRPIGFTPGSTTYGEGTRLIVPNSNNPMAIRKIFGLGTAPGLGDTFIHTAQINAVSTTVTCTRTAALNSCSSTTPQATIVGGDDINIISTPTSSPTVGVTNYVGFVIFIDPKSKLYGSSLYGSTIY